MTNVPPTVWAPEVIVTVYRIRWQIELLFKQWKSLLQIRVLTGTRPERIKCLLYGRLTTITMVMRLCAYAAWYAAAVLHREISLYKLIAWLKRTGRFAHAIHEGTIEALYSDLRRDMAPLLCKQKRKRQTSQQLLEEDRHPRERCAQKQKGLEDQAA
jgi:hypothetical protein